MAVAPDSPDDHETRLNELLAEFMEAAESGAAIDSEALLADRPELADELVEFQKVAAQVDQYVAGLVSDDLEHDAPRRAFGDYELLAEIGRGGMGVVYRARQKSLNRLVAVKMIRGGAGSSELECRRFRFEAEAAAHLDHSHIVPIYEIGEFEGLPFFSMKLFEGGSLVENIDEFRGNPRRTAELAATIARAVHHAHQRGILHRDLKPSNILLDREGRPHVADFGLARWLAPDQGQTQSGFVMGTPIYMAPEQLAPPEGASEGSAATTASDVYGLGAILYTLLAGEPPFLGRAPFETFLAVREREPVAPGKQNPRVDRDLDTICLKCLEKDPARRYVSAAALAEDLERWLAGEPILARPAGNFERAGRWCRRNPRLAAMTGLAGALLLLGIGILLTAYVLVSRAQQASEGHRIDAERQAAQLRQRLYSGQIALGFRHWERGGLAELRALLDEFRDDDLKGFEWYWLDAQTRTKPSEKVSFAGHRGTVFCAAYSSDGRTVASTSEDRSIQLWDPDTGDLRTTLRPRPDTAMLPVKGHAEDENCVCFSPDGRRLASGCEDGSVRLWDLSDESWQALLPSHKGEVYCTSFSPDGRLLVTGGADGIVFLRDISDPDAVVELRGHEGPVYTAVISPDGQTIVSADVYGVMKVWDRDGHNVKFSANCGGSVHCLGFSPDGSLLASGGRTGAIRLWDPATWTPAGDLHPAAGIIRSLDISFDTARLACVGDDGCISVWSIAGGDRQCFFNPQQDRLWSVRFARDGRRLLIGSGDRMARIWELPAPRAPARWEKSRSIPVKHLAFSPTSDALVMSTNDGRLFMADATTPEMLTSLPVECGSFSQPVFSPDGVELAFIGRGGTIRRWHLEENRELSPFQPPGLEAPSPGTSPEATRLAWLDVDRLVALRCDGTLMLCDRGRWTEQRTPCRSVGLPAVLVPLVDGKRLVVRDQDKSIFRTWNFELGEFESAIPYARPGESSAYSFDRKMLAMTTSNKNVSLFDLASGTETFVLLGHTQNVSRVAFSVDGRTLASGSYDGTVRLWHVATGQEFFVLKDRRRPVLSLSFSRDGRFLAVAGEPHEDGASVSVYDSRPPQ